MRGPLHRSLLQSDELISPQGITLCCLDSWTKDRLFQFKKKKMALRAAVVPVVVEVFQNCPCCTAHCVNELWLGLGLQQGQAGAGWHPNDDFRITRIPRDTHNMAYN